MANLFELFLDPPGSTLYFLIVFVMGLAAFYVAFAQGQRTRNDQGVRKYTIAGAGIVLGWAALSLGPLLSRISGLPLNAILPPIEHAISTIIIVLVGWAFLSADAQQSKRMWSFVVFGLVVLVVAGAVITLIQWQEFASVIDFTSSSFALTWTFIPLSIAVLLLILLVIRFAQVPDAPLKIIFFAVLIFGYGFAVMQVARGELRGDAIGIVRGVLLLSMPFYLLVVYRYVITKLVYASPVSTGMIPVDSDGDGMLQRSTAPSGAAEREAVHLLRTLGEMLESQSPDDLPAHIVMATARTLKADIVALGKVSDTNWLDFVISYDHVQQRNGTGNSINLNDQRTLAQAITSRRQLSINAEENVQELVDLYTRLDLRQSGPFGPAYFQPLQQAGQVVAVIIVIFPYTTRDLRRNERTLLEGIAPIASKLMTFSRAVPVAALATPPSVSAEPDADVAAAAAARQEMLASLEMAYGQIEQLSNVVDGLRAELEGEQTVIATKLAEDDETLSLSQQMLALSQETGEIETQRSELASKLQDARTALAGVTASDNDELIHSIVAVLNNEHQALQAQKNKLEQQLQILRDQTGDMFLVPASIQETLTALNEDKSHLADERDAIAAELHDVRSELDLLGVDGGVAGLALVLGQLYEERDQLKAQLAQSSSGEAVLSAAVGGDQAQIKSLQEELARFAGDRESIAKQRDTLLQEQSAWQKERAEWHQQRQQLGQQIAGIQKQIRENDEQRVSLQQERNTLSQERAALMQERDRLLADRTGIETERDQLLAQVEGNRALLQQFGADGMDNLKAMIDTLTDERSGLEYQLLQAKSELDTMDSKLKVYENAAINATNVMGPRSNSDDPEVILSIAQELRTPMSSITGYTDLLLGESVGILGALQRKFLQRVKANIERLGALIEDLVSVIALDAGHVDISPEPVDMLDIIDDAITNAGTQFREKGITLNLEFDDVVPDALVDRDAMHQVLTQLLSNAYLASPTDGEVSIVARQDAMPYAKLDGTQVDVPALFVAIQDQGSGIPPEDQARVFSRLYRADNPLIQGVGDTGVGLSIARALIEAHQGKIWVESEAGVGTRFVFTIPFSPVTE